MNIGLTDVRNVVARSALLLAFAAALVLGPQATPDPALRAVLPLVAILILLQFAPIMWLRHPDLFSPPVFSGIVAGFGTAATLASWYMNGELSLDLVRGSPGEELQLLAQKALVALILGMVCYYLGYYSNLGVWIRRLFPNVRGLVWDRGRVLIVCFLTATVFVVAYGVFQSRLGVSLVDITQLAAGKAVWREDATLSWMMRGIEIGFLPVILFLSWTLAKKRGLASLLVPLLILLAMAGLSSRVGQRGPALYVVLTILVLFHYHRRRVPVSLFIGMFFVGIVVLNIMLAWRLQLNGEDPDVNFATLVDEASDPTTTLAAHEGERQRFSSLALIMREFPEAHPYLMGQSWASIVVAPIPRWLWPDKVEHFPWQDDRIIFQLVGTPTPPPFVGTLYANLSWIGIVIGTLLLGAVHRGLYEWFQEGNGDQNVVLLYALFLVYFGPSTLNVSMTMQYVIPMWLILRFIGRRAPVLVGA